MHFNLYDYQSEACRYYCGLTFLKTRVTRNQKRTIDSHTPKKKRNSSIKIKENHQIKKEKEEKINKNKLQNQLENRVNMAMSTYLSIITFNGTGLMALIKTYRVKFKMMALMNKFAGQQRRCRHKEQTFGHSRGKKEKQDLRQQH